MKFTRSKHVSDIKPRADRCCKTGLFGSLTALGVCFFTSALFGFMGLAFRSPYQDYYVFLPLIVVSLLLVLYGWLRGGKIHWRNRFPPAIFSLVTIWNKQERG